MPRRPPRIEDEGGDGRDAPVPARSPRIEDEGGDGRDTGEGPQGQAKGQALGRGRPTVDHRHMDDMSLNHSKLRSDNRGRKVSD